jgi:MOSC domain-containing protein YiiM
LSKSTATVLSLFITDAEKSTQACDMLDMDNQGIVGDKHYGKDPNRTVLITSVKAYDILKQNGISASHGSLGENLVVDFDLDALKPGDQLQIGEVVVEIAQNCTLCNHLSAIDKRVPKLLRHDRGIFAKVVQGGRLHLNDEVRVII